MAVPWRVLVTPGANRLSLLHPGEARVGAEWVCVLARFQREAQAASALNHANIATIHEIDEQNAKAFIATEFLEGETLKEAIAGRRPMELEQLLSVALEVADGSGRGTLKGNCSP